MEDSPSDLIDAPARTSGKHAGKSSKAPARAPAAASAAPKPRRLGAAKIWAILFFALGLLALWASFIEAAVSTEWAPDTALTFLLQVIPPVVAVLIPGAFLYRHPDAPRRARTLLFGTLVFASVTFFRAIEGGMQAAFKELTPPPTGLDWFIPSSLTYTSFVSVIGLFGLLYIGLGLAKARNYAFTTRARNAGLVILAVAAISIAGRLWTLTKVDLSDPTLTPDLWFYIGSIIVIGVLTILTWAYVARTLTRCALSGEEPVSAWNVAAIGACLAFSTYLVVSWSSFVTISDQTLSNVVVYLREILTAVGELLLLVGFAMGLPSLERVVWDDEEPTA